MKKLLFLITALLFAGTVHAQTVLQVPFDKATFSWDPPPNPLPAGTSPPTHYLMNCGGADVRIEAPATSVPAKDVLSGPGNYTCTLKAANQFGVSSAPSNAVTFETGFRPADVNNFRIEVR